MKLKPLIWLLFPAILLVGCAERPDPDASGEEIYSQLCARCHAGDLSGGIGSALGAGSDLVAQPDEYLRLSISRGIGRMPSFGNTLSEEQIERVIDFIRLKQQEP